MFQPANEGPDPGLPGAVWNISTFQTTNESRCPRAIRPLSFRLEHVMFQT